MEKTTTLREGFTLRGKGYVYHIEHVLGQGSFGITYLATTKVSVKGELGNIETEIRVAIKEFYMHEFCSRHDDGTITEMTQGTLVANYAKKFRKEAENLAKLSHPNIVKVLEVFDANNTTYYAMEYIPGGSLDAYVKQQGGLSEEEAIACIRQIGSALGYMHDHKMLHLDLKPANVMRSADGSRLTLIDFGLSKQYEENGNPESSTSIGLGTLGYAPIEQSSSDRDKDFAPTLDVYALGATFFKLLTGQTPPKASDVLNEGLPVQSLKSKGVSHISINALEQAMEPRKPKRLKTVSSFLSLLNGDVTQFDWVELSPSSLDLEEGMTRLLTVRVSSEEDRKRLRWQSLSPSVAKVDGSGRVTAVGVGTALICVTCGTAVAQCNLTVYARHKPPVPKKWLYGVVGAIIAAVVVVLAIGKGNQDIAVESINVTPSELSLKEGESKRLSVEFTPGNATDKSTVWISSDNGIANVDNTTGNVTALKAGKATITAVSGSKTAYCNVTVKPKAQQQSTRPSQGSTTGKHYGREYVDLGLPSGLLWATCNIGASSPSDYGNYYAWGETGAKSVFSWENLKYRTSGDSYINVKFSKYVATSKYGNVDNKRCLDLSDDAARANWGGNWRMPTVKEWDELKSNCTWTWTSQGGHNGYKVTGKNGAYIFLPAAGFRSGSSLYDAGEYGFYWSSSLYGGYSYDAFDCYFRSDGVNPSDWLGRFGGRSVRPVVSSLQK